MVGAMETDHLSSNEFFRKKNLLKSIFYPQFESSILEKKYQLTYLKNIYPLNHRLLVIILISHSLLNLIEIFLIKSEINSSKIISLSLLCSTICLNIFSLIIIKSIRNILLSNIISLICLSPFIILTCLYPMEYHIYILIILIYTLSNIYFPLTIIISMIITVLTLKLKIRLILLLIIINIIGIYLNRLLDLTIRSAYDQLCQSKF